MDGDLFYEEEDDDGQQYVTIIQMVSLKDILLDGEPISFLPYHNSPTGAFVTDEDYPSLEFVSRLNYKFNTRVWQMTLEDYNRWIAEPDDFVPEFLPPRMSEDGPDIILN